MLWIWLGFILFVLAVLALDLGVFHRDSKAMGAREALVWSGVWVLLALTFTAFVYYGYESHWMGLGTGVDAVDALVNDGGSASVKFLTGYVLEKSLSVDNLFVIALLFSAFAVPATSQHRVLVWGILGALVMRGAMIAVGAELVSHHAWVLYVFGAFLLVTAARMIAARGSADDGAHAVERHVFVRLVRRWLPVAAGDRSGRFFTRVDGRWALAPPALALVAVEGTDLLFAVDSIPAVFAVTADPFLVFTSNVFAILGMRSLYFALAGLMRKFVYLDLALAIVLAVIGAKMLGAHWLHHWFGPAFNFYLLGLVGAILTAGVVASLRADRGVPRGAA